MKKVIFAVLAVLIAGGAAGAYWYGNQPKLTYYPNGNIKTSIEQKLFKLDGEYKVFNEDGTLAQKYTVVDGIKTGSGFIYAGGVTAEVYFVNGTLSGPIKLDTKGKVPEIDNLQINAAGGELTVNIAAPEQKGAADTASVSAPSYVIGSRITCDESEFLDGMQAFLQEQNLDTFKNFSKCLSLTSGKIDDVLYNCEYKGAYQYPKFTAETMFECNLKDDGKQMLDMMLADSDIKDIGNLKASLSYSPSDRKFFFQAFDDKGVYHNVQSFKGMEEAISALTEFAFSKQESKDAVKMASDILNNLTITDSQLEVDGKVVSAVNGEFNFIKGFSNPWTASYFGAENVLTSQVKITDKGLVTNLAYPISKKPFISLGIQIDESIKDKYKSLVELIFKEFSEKSEDEATANLMNVMPKYAMSFSDVVKSVNFLLMNNKGEKVLGSVLNVKPKADFMEMTEDFFKVFDIKIISYQNNKPYQVIVGDTTNGFVVNDKVVAPEELDNYLDIDTIEKVIKQAEEEYEQISKSSKSANGDPVFGAASGWYYSDLGVEDNNDVADIAEDVDLEIVVNNDEAPAAAPATEVKEAAPAVETSATAPAAEVKEAAPAVETPAAAPAAEVKEAAPAVETPAVAPTAEVKEAAPAVEAPAVAPVAEVKEAAPAVAPTAEVKEAAPVEVKENVEVFEVEDDLLSTAPTE